MQEQSVSTYVSAIFQESKSDSWFFSRKKPETKAYQLAKKGGAF